MSKAKKFRQLMLPVDDGMDQQIPPKGWTGWKTKVTQEEFFSQDYQNKLNELLRKIDPATKDDG